MAAASWFLFGRDPRSLSLGETALLLTLPRAPNALDPVRHPETSRRVRDALVDRLVAQGVIAPAAAAEARRQPLPRSWRRTPFAAPHVALRAVSRRPRAAHLATTIDAEMQARAEDLVRRRATVLRTLGIGNAAAVVIERGDRAVRAWVGSADYFDRERLGQVDGVVAARSPGSALKPFLYALAYDAATSSPTRTSSTCPPTTAATSPRTTTTATAAGSPPATRSFNRSTRSAVHLALRARRRFAS